MVLFDSISSSLLEHVLFMFQMVFGFSVFLHLLNHSYNFASFFFFFAENNFAKIIDRKLHEMIYSI